MKTSAFLLLILCLIAVTSNAQSKDEAAVATAVEALRDAMLNGDRVALETLTAPALTYGHSSGTIEDKSAFVEALASGKSDFVSINLSNQTISIVDDIALVRHELRGELASGPVNLGVLLVWQKRKGTWLLLARQAFRL